MNMGLACEVEVRRPEVEFAVDGKRLYPGESVRMAYYSSFTLDGEGPFSMGEVQYCDYDNPRSRIHIYFLP